MCYVVFRHVFLKTLGVSLYIMAEQKLQQRARYLTEM